MRKLASIVTVATATPIPENDRLDGTLNGIGCHHDQLLIKTVTRKKEHASILSRCATIQGVRMASCFQNGFADACNAISFHVYSANEHWDKERILNLKQVIRDAKSSIKLFQGEGGCQSRHDGCGALHGQARTREKQAKSFSRHIISQLGHDVMIASNFSCLDMAEALQGNVGDKSSYMDYGYFGVLGADFDENGFATGESLPSHHTDLFWSSQQSYVRNSPCSTQWLKASKIGILATVYSSVLCGTCTSIASAAPTVPLP